MHHNWLGETIDRNAISPGSERAEVFIDRTEVLHFLLGESEAFIGDRRESHLVRREWKVFFY